MAEAVCVLAHLALPESPQVKQLCHLYAQLSLGQSCHRQKKSLASIHAGSLWLCPTLCDPVDCGLPGFSVRDGVLQARIPERIGHTGCHTLLEHYISYCPSQNTPRSTWCCQNPCDSSICTSSTPGPHPSPRETQVLQDSLRSKPQWMTPCRGGNKTIIETQGQCG